MKPVTTITSPGVPLLRDNIDTDTIIPSREMRTTGRTGLADGLFAPWRYTDAAARLRDPSFVLNQRDAIATRLLLAGQNFGCGSSREHAVWALADFGIRCIVAPSFGDIFHANCLKNGLLPVTLETSDYDVIKRAALDMTPIEVDLQDQCIRIDDTVPVPFDIDAAGKQSLLNGLDEVDGILAEDADAISAFEKRQKELTPWLWL